MKIVCLGDSHTFGFGIPRSEIWTSLANDATASEIINRGMNGDTTGGMLARFDKDVASIRPDAVLLMGGGNDVLFSQTFAAAQSNMAALVHWAAAAGIMPMIGVPIDFVKPIRGDWSQLMDVDTVLRVWEEYRLWLYQFCHVLQLPFVDFRGEMRQYFHVNGRNAADYYVDGLHVNPMGHRIMADIMIDFVRDLERKFNR